MRGDTQAHRGRDVARGCADERMFEGVLCVCGVARGVTGVCWSAFRLVRVGVCVWERHTLSVRYSGPIIELPHLAPRSWRRAGLC